MTKIEVQTTKYETTRQSGVQAMSQSEKVNQALTMLRIVCLMILLLDFEKDEIVEGVEGD